MLHNKLIHNKTLRASLSIAWLLVIAAVLYAIYDRIELGRIDWDHANIPAIMLSLAMVMLASLPMYWIQIDYFPQLKQLNKAWAESWVLCFLPLAGKYIPGKIWAFSGFVIQARMAANLPVKETSFYQGYAFMVSLVSTAILLLLSLFMGLGGLHASTWLSLIGGLLACLLLAGLGLFAMRRILSGIGQQANWMSLLRHSLAMTLQKLGKVASLLVFLSAFIPVTDMLAEIAVAYFLATQAGALAFFAPAGLGVTEGFYVLVLSGPAGLEPAITIALLARVWLTLGDALLVISAAWLKFIYLSR